MTVDSFLLQATGLTCAIAGRRLWENVSLDLRPGEVLGLVSPSGTGKTLLLRQLGLLDSVQSGRIKFRNRTPAQWTFPVYRTKVIYLSQRPTIFPGTGLANLQHPFSLAVHHQRTFDLGQIQVWLAQLGRTLDFLERPGTELSGGEAQILALLRALQLDPHILLLDEPTASLDAATTLALERLLLQWLQQPDKACILTSHDLSQIQRLSQSQLNLQPFQP
ncbi:ATP-binding cassette domain-containing protein [Thermosynechococcaceae cyanobacterium BACA0444]|uniref:ATP-binding cassette domain-containing protein n=1 Tax=Pseudocalidococcus azoricus BACA0444 TaxID=2918990 RepID=A0AAE4FQX3_9CYAN|nr:ATP-binding cassette domain-containing protein [Pseudocalidococcus azoricus]MDS3859897.1 ATP-binding cassette domain-containing protein [Pseudocalidococcus azoricus BACA0444]